MPLTDWKVKGVVPDTDDEDSSDDERDISNEEPAQLEQDGAPQVKDAGATIHEREHEDGNGNHGGYRSRSFGRNNHAERNLAELERPAEEGLLAPSEANEIEDTILLLPSSPAQSPVFKDPREFWDVDGTFLGRSESPGPVPEDPLAAIPERDDVSTTYVRLTSSLSSILSSPPTSQTLRPTLPDSTGHNEGLQQIERASQVFLAQEPRERRQIQNGRSFRHRNPIQLHPYALEQEKYRRTLKARGLAPMRLAQNDEEPAARREERAFSEAESRYGESQSIEVEPEDSQTEAINWGSSQGSSQDVRHTPIRDEPEFGGLGDDEDLPDIDQILRGSTQLPSTKRTPQLKSYSKKQQHLSKSRPPSLLQINTQRTASRSIFDIPASPPTTSSPMVALGGHERHLMLRTTSMSSGSSAILRPHDDEAVFRQPLDLPTPAKSVEKSVPKPIVIESESESASESGSETDTSLTTARSVSPSSSNGAGYLKKIGKKIRGVLPASHVRLDHRLKKSLAPARAWRDDSNLSPVKDASRRGIAQPVAPRSKRDIDIESPSFHVFSDDSEDDEDMQGKIDFPLLDQTYRTSLSTKNCLGYAEEDDRVDAMLPGHSRPGRGPDTRPRKRRRIGSSHTKRQPRITEHLLHPRESGGSTSRSMRKPKRAARRSAHAESQSERREPPRLSILDVMGSPSDHGLEHVPQFLRIAARTARRNGPASRHSPSTKFIRLSNREDTADAQSVLQDWRNGKIKPKDNVVYDSSRDALRQIAGNSQTRLQLSDAHKPPRSGLQVRTGRATIPHKLSANVQRSMEDFVTEATVSQPAIPAIRNQRSGQYNFERKRQNKTLHEAQLARPAQLEVSTTARPRFLAASFGREKDVLDLVYKKARKGRAPRTNLQINRFLAESHILPSIESNDDIEIDVMEAPQTNIAGQPSQPLRIRKRLPKRIDVGAASYRQPTDPLILNWVKEVEVVNNESDTKLKLFKYGARYSTHFDVSPLQPGITFHEGTIIGSGRLKTVLQDSGHSALSSRKDSMLFHLGDKEFRWNVWNDNISSDIGECFDWLCLNLKSETSEISSRDDPVSMITSIIDFVQSHLSFSTLQDHRDFLARMIEVVEGLLSRSDLQQISRDLLQTHRRIEVTARCTILVLQLLHSSRAASQLPTAIRLEDLLVKTAECCLLLLIQHGLNDVRQLYEDLQYLSFREKGILSSRFAPHAWVMLSKVVNHAKIPRKSFWDVLNPLLGSKGISMMIDVRFMENIWSSLFSLVPLGTFDDLGVVVGDPGRIAYCDNWALAQQLLQRVFGLYKANSRQAPGFNEYCRALFIRCHILVTEWNWWKCGGVIGTLFDLFADQNLSNLRNEEIHKSPDFLDMLDKEPSLAVEPGDRCFHIFLKVVAIGIKKMRQKDDIKGVQNLVARLTPNHDRLYPKEEDVLQRELASLRNHHDLLSVLFWTSPPDMRSSLGLLEQIQGLVDPDRSHNQACLINLRAWNYLARFVLASPTYPGAFGPFIEWQSIFFEKILTQYIQEDANTRYQASNAAVLQAPIAETLLQTQIITNRRSTMVILKRILADIAWAVSTARDGIATMEALNSELICKLLNPDICGMLESKEDFTVDIIHVLATYMDRIDSLHPYATTDSESSAMEDDSQGSFGLSVEVNMDRQLMIYPLYGKILPGLCTVVRRILEGRLYAEELPFMKQMIECWARLASIVTEETLQLNEFLPRGTNSVFDHRHDHVRANSHWPLFLAQLVKYKTLDDFEISGFDFGLEWMLALSVDPSAPFYQRDLSEQLYQKGHAFVKSSAAYEAIYWKPILPAVSLALRLIKNAIDYMRETLQDSSGRELYAHFSKILREVMETMQCRLETMVLNSPAHVEYVDYCQKIVTQIRSRGSAIQPLTAFFVNPSIYYWPEAADPKLYAAGIVSYSLRLQSQWNKTSSELFHYLYRGWRDNIIKGRLDVYVGYLGRGLKQWPFLDFMLSTFVPAALDVGFSHELGWIFPIAYLPSLSSRVRRILEKGGDEAATTFGYMVEILKTIANGVATQDLSWEMGLDVSHLLDRGMIAVACQFWLAVHPALKIYAADHTIDTDDFDNVTHTLGTFARLSTQRLQLLDGAEHEMITFEVVEKPQVKTFTTTIVSDIQKTWTTGDDMDTATRTASAWLSIKGMGSRDDNRIDMSQLWGRTLQEILEVGMSELDVESSDRGIMMASLDGQDLFF